MYDDGKSRATVRVSVSVRASESVPFFFWSGVCRVGPRRTYGSARRAGRFLVRVFLVPIFKSTLYSDFAR